MRAFALESFESPAAWIEVPDPEPGEGEVLVRVRSSSVNGFDIWVASGLTKGMMEHEFPVVVGRDFAGTIEGVGSGVTRFLVGDEVLGFLPEGEVLHDGCFAELLVIRQNSFIASKPTELGFGEAGALTLAAITALQAVKAVDPAEGDTVLVAGATGGVGSLAVQLVAARGATVIATALPGDEEYLKGLGASETVDYTRDVAEAVRAAHSDGIDGLIDVANRDVDIFASLASLIRGGGRAASAVGAADAEKLATDDVTAANVMGSADPEDAARAAELASSGVIRVPIQRTYPADRIAEALTDFSNEHTVGKLAIDLTSASS